jgi:Zn-dependent M28 family amino/carboxypeptidase
VKKVRKGKKGSRQKVWLSHPSINRVWSLVGLLALIAVASFWKGCSGTVSISINAPTVHPAVSAFDGNHAFDLLVKQVEFGPRVPGSKASQQVQDFIAQKLKEAGAMVLRQPFVVTYRGKTYQMANIIGVISGRSERKVLLCAHYDTRPVADQDPNPANRDKPIPGANDGASGVAVLLEIAQVLKGFKPPLTVVFVFFDGEDLGDVEDGGMFFGSKYFARNLTIGGFNLKAEMGVLLDMVGDRDFASNDEWYSRRYAPQVVTGLLQAATHLGYQRYFFRPPTIAILDDHVPLNEIANIPTANIIDFDYPYWHTLQDTPDKCSPETLAIVGKTVLQWLMNLKP